MKSFLLKFGWFLALQAALLAGVFRANRGTLERGYLAAYADKLARLEHLAPPRLILVGGSSMAFGVDSRMLEEELGRPVVNLGLHAATGMEFQLNTLRPFLRRGDVVVLGLEYEILDGFARTFEILQIAFVEPRALGRLAGIQQKQVLDELHLFLGGLVRSCLQTARERRLAATAVWSRKAFTERGDIRASLRRPSLVAASAAGPVPRGRFPQNNSPLPLPDRPRLARHMRALQAFVQEASRAGAVVTFTHPPHPRPRLARSARALAEYARALETCAGLVVLDGALDRGYPWELFFDNFYHLNAAGMARHTEDLITVLRPRLADTE
jgi:hypothetical protein